MASPTTLSERIGAELRTRLNHPIYISVCSLILSCFYPPDRVPSPSPNLFIFLRRIILSCASGTLLEFDRNSFFFLCNYMALSLKAELEIWAAALKAYDEQDFLKSLELFSVRSTVMVFRQS